MVAPVRKMAELLMKRRDPVQEKINFCSILVIDDVALVVDFCFQNPLLIV